MVSPAAEPTTHDQLCSYLPELIDHDLAWFKEAGKPTLRPLLVLATSSDDPLSSNGSRLFDNDWRYRPNVCLIRSTPAAAPNEHDLQIFFTLAGTEGSADPQTALDCVADAIVAVSESITSGSQSSLRFPQEVPGWVVN